VQIGCVGTNMYALTTPVRHDMTVERNAMTINGTYQAGP
jgi:hypothetical protein